MRGVGILSLREDTFAWKAAGCAGPPRFGPGNDGVGELGGASYRVDVPASWIGGLVMYCHGYDASALRFHVDAPDSAVQAVAPAGSALAQSGYAMGGYVVEEAVRDTEALRRRFVSKYGAPRETWVSESSLGVSGGAVSMMLMETYPNAYDARRRHLGVSNHTVAANVFVGDELGSGRSPRSG